MVLAVVFKLGHNRDELLPFMSHDLGRSKGHAGVTWVKKYDLL